jgi:uncharacterized protein YlxW (UPF0749 family)
MADQSLKETFFTTLRASKSYSLLSAEEQKHLLEVFANSTDEQLRAGLEALKTDAAKQKMLEVKLAEQQKNTADLAVQIKSALKEIDSSERKENEKVELAESSDAADKLLASIGAPTEKEKQKRKKFLGIF